MNCIFSHLQFSLHLSNINDVNFVSEQLNLFLISLIVASFFIVKMFIEIMYYLKISILLYFNLTILTRIFLHLSFVVHTILPRWLHSRIIAVRVNLMRHSDGLLLPTRRQHIIKASIDWSSIDFSLQLTKLLLPVAAVVRHVNLIQRSLILRSWKLFVP